MRFVIVGMGVQGQKRRKVLGKAFKYSVDKFKKADYKFINQIPLDEYDAVIACVPDSEKLKIVKYCIENKKNVLIEKPFFIPTLKIAQYMKKKIKQNKVVCYTAYNHRFEPHFKKMKDLINSNVLGKIYSCRMFYGNGTAKLVNKSKWRDKDLGIITDLGSHLLDTCLFWFGKKVKDFKLVSSRRFENKSPDHAVLISENSIPKLELEMTYLMWINNFICDFLAEKGSAHISSLCKWGPSVFTYRKRVFPSGKPKEKKKILIQKDPTWLSEFKYYKGLIYQKKITDFSKDIWIQNQIYKSSKNKLF